MTGQHIQDLMKQEGYSVNEMAKMIGKAQQVLASALKHDDIRTGLLEDIAQAMGKPLSFFYGETFGSMANITGNHNATATGSNNTVTTNDDRLLTLLLNKDEQLTMAMNQTSKAQAQTDKAQEQMDRILDKYLGKGSK